MPVVPHLLSIHDFLLARDPGLAAEVERHQDRTMTVVSFSGRKTITRCGRCPKEDSRPCRALRALALRYAHHPAYRPEWLITPPNAVAVPSQGTGAAAHDGRRVPPPYPRIADMPPPGKERRSLLAQFGITIRRRDFTEAELAGDGFPSDPRTDGLLPE